ncbi:MAG: ComF family protein [Candidatus Gottesmanbacteria bacterium]
MNVKEILLNLLFPKRCISCGKFGKYICVKCRKKIKPINFQVCPACERPAIGGATHPKCQSKYSLDGLTSFFIYDGPIRKAIKELKYRLVTDLARELVSLTEDAGDEFFQTAIQKQTAEVGTKIFYGTKPARIPTMSRFRSSKILCLPAVWVNDANNLILVPVPLHWRRENWRGFNQSEVLGKILAQKLDVKFIPDLLIRKKFTQPQVELKGDERQKNIQNAFTLNHNSSFIIHNSNIIVFDDVWTTGSTLRSCGRVLKEAGVKKVWGMTLAR